MEEARNRRAAPEVADEFMSGGGEMGALMRSLDWASTPLGPIESWSQSLKTMVSVCLNSRFPICLWWGPELAMLYNDAYRPMLGAAKHPGALGRAGRDCWPEIWHIIGPMLEGVLREGRATWSDDQLLFIDRNGYLEECYFTISYSPIRDESGGVGGIFTAVTETTGCIVGERRLETLRKLGAQANAVSIAAEEACSVAIRTLSENDADFPFASLYLLEADGTQARLIDAARIAPDDMVVPRIVALDQQGGAGWPLAAVASSGKPQIVDDVLSRFGPLPGGRWEKPPHSAMVLPINAPGQGLAGFLVAGLSPLREFDETYRSFLESVAGHIGAALANARAYRNPRF